MKRIAVLSDTHGYLDEGILRHIRDCDEAWHAGDIGSAEVSEALQACAPLRAVYGNIDGGELRQMHPEHLHMDCEGIRVWMTHIGGKPGRYSPAIRAGLAKHKPDLFICGHSHICMLQRDKQFGHIHMNPGAAGRHGFHQKRTLIKMELEKGKIAAMKVVELGGRSSRSPEDKRNT